MSVKVVTLPFIDQTHHCTYLGCKETFMRDQNIAAHHRLYIHAKKMHGVTITLSCFETCPHKNAIKVRRPRKNKKITDASNT